MVSPAAHLSLDADSTKLAACDLCFLLVPQMVKRNPFWPMAKKQSFINGMVKDALK